VRVTAISYTALGFGILYDTIAFTSVEIALRMIWDQAISCIFGTYFETQRKVK